MLRVCTSSALEKWACIRCPTELGFYLAWLQAAQSFLETPQFLELYQHISRAAYSLWLSSTCSTCTQTLGWPFWVCEKTVLSGMYFLDDFTNSAWFRLESCLLELAHLSYPAAYSPHRTWLLSTSALPFPHSLSFVSNYWGCFSRCDVFWFLTPSNSLKCFVPGLQLAQAPSCNYMDPLTSLVCGFRCSFQRKQLYRIHTMSCSLFECVSVSRTCGGGSHHYLQPNN